MTSNLSESEQHGPKGIRWSVVRASLLGCSGCSELLIAVRVCEFAGGLPEPVRIEVERSLSRIRRVVRSEQLRQKKGLSE